MTLEEMEKHFPKDARGLAPIYRQEVNKHRPVYFFQDDAESPAICYSCGDMAGKGLAHKQEYTCPYCGGRGRVVVTSRYHCAEMHKLRKEDLLYVYHPSEIDPEVLTCTVIYTMWYFSLDDPVRSEPLSYVDARYIFIPGQGGVYTSRPHKLWREKFYNGKIETYLHYNVDPRDEPLEVRKSCRDRFNNYQRESLNVYVESLHSLERLTKGTSMQYAIEAYSDWISYENHIALLDRLYKWPRAMEQLGKIGLTSAIETAIRNGEGLCRTFNMNGRSLWKILRCRLLKEDLKFLLETNQMIYLSDVRKYQEFRLSPMAKGVSFEDTTKLARHWGVYIIMKYVQLKKAIAYTAKQGSTISIYADYLRDCEKLHMDLTSKSVLYPKNLGRLHVELQSQIKHQANEIARKKWQKRYMECVEKYSYADDDYCVIVPSDIRDLIREGKDMHNCVGGYIDRVVAGDTDVVYIRRRAASEESFGTMEIYEGKIIQARGKYNKELPEDAKEFVERFKKNMLSAWQHRRKGAV